MKNFYAGLAAAIGFIAPITVGWAAGVQLGTANAGIFLAFSWGLSLFLGFTVKAIQEDIGE